MESFTAGGTFTFFDEYAEANGVTLTVKDVTLKDVTTAQDTPQYTYTATITCQKADGTFAEKNAAGKVTLAKTADGGYAVSALVRADNKEFA